MSYARAYTNCPLTDLEPVARLIRERQGGDKPLGEVKFGTVDNLSIVTDDPDLCDRIIAEFRVLADWLRAGNQGP